MDKKDKQILYYLDQNARMSYTQIAKLTKVTQETVRYRVNNLIKQGIIDGFITIINQPKLGITPYQIMLKLQNTDEEKKKRIITYLKENKNIAALKPTDPISPNILIKNTEAPSLTPRSAIVTGGIILLENITRVPAHK